MLPGSIHHQWHQKTEICKVSAASCSKVPTKQKKSVAWEKGRKEVREHSEDWS